MRSILVGVLLALGGLLALSANATVWANRVVFNTDRFTANVNRALDDPKVQQQLSVRLSDIIIEQGDVNTRLANDLPPGLKPLAGPVENAASESIQRATLRVLQSPRGREILDGAIRGVHSQVVAILENESDAVAVQNGEVVLDLNQVLGEVAQELGVGAPNGLVSRLDLPPDAGTIVIAGDANRASTISSVVSLHGEIVWALVGATLLAFGAAVLVSKKRRATVRNIGFVLVVVGILGAIALVPIRGVVASLAGNPDAARVLFNDLVVGYRWQSLAVIFVGGLIALGAVLAGDSRLAVAVRGNVRRNDGEAPAGFADEVRQAAPLLHVGGLVVGALVLLAWPEPTNRVYVTTLFLLAAYFAGIWTLTSDSSWAASAREHIDGVWQRLSARSEGVPGFRGWIGRQAAAFRIAGVGIAGLLVILWPGLTFASLVAILAMALLYLALIEWLVTVRD